MDDECSNAVGLSERLERETEEAEVNFNHNDPATWLHMTDKLRCFLVEQGPKQNKI